MIFNIYTFLDWLAGIIVFSLGLVIFLGSRRPSSRSFSVMAFLAALWAAGTGIIMFTPNDVWGDFFARFNYFFGGSTAAVFIYFSFLFPEERRQKIWFKIFLAAVGAGVFYLLFFTNLILVPFKTPAGFWWGRGRGPLWFIFDFFFAGFWITSLITLYWKLKKYPSGNTRTQLKYIFWGMLIGFVPPTVATVLLPRLGHFNYLWMGPVSYVGWMSVVSYAIARFNALNVKAIAAEIFVLVMSVILFVNIFVSESVLGVLGKTLIFLAFAGVGYLFIQSVLRESEQKEKLEKLTLELRDLNEHLQEKVEEQTSEIRRAYEVEKKARLEIEKLDKIKDEFILTTQHHLRTPISVIKGFVQNLIQAPSQKFDLKTQEALQKIDQHTDQLTKLVNEFLDISQLEVGKEILSRKPVKISELLEEIRNEYGPEAKNRGLYLNLYLAPEIKDAVLDADRPKLKEALSVFVDNALKYTKTGGLDIYARVSLHPIEKKKILTIEFKDTGIGIPPEEISRLFVKYFERGKEARKIYTTGKGIGLVLAKNIVAAHGGRTWAESAGLGKGSSFWVELEMLP